MERRHISTRRAIQHLSPQPADHKLQPEQRGETHGEVGRVEDDTSIHRLATDGTPGRFVIDDLGQQLDGNEGLFVYTTQSGDSGNAYYAVTQVNGGSEDRQIRPGTNSDKECRF